MADNRKVKEVMDSFNVDVVYINSAGDVFLTEKKDTTRICRSELETKKNQKVKDNGE